MFLGRQRELNLLRKELSRKNKTAILIYGRRRIGKTSLISEALKSASGIIIRFTAVPDELGENARRLSVAVGDALGIPGLHIPDFESLLKYIASLNQDMKGLLNKENPLYKRFSLELSLGELDYLESSLFYPERSVSEKIVLYSVFGGIPMILSMIDPELSVEENIIALLLERTGLARSYTEDILYAELKSSGGAYSAITRIGNGKRSYSEIRSALEDDESRNSLDYTLEQLQKADFIEKRQPINLRGSRRKMFYELKSNMLRFHLAYIEKHPEAMASTAFFRKYISPSLDTFVSYRFEDIARQWFLIQAGKGIRDDIISIGTYWYDDKNTKSNGEFDVAIETLDGYEIYEAKFLSHPMKEALIKEETSKIRKIAGLQISAIGFISSSGFERPGGKRISGQELYSL